MKIPFEYKYNLIMIKAGIGIKVGGEALFLNCLLDTGSDKTIITPPYIKALGVVGERQNKRPYCKWRRRK